MSVKLLLLMATVAWLIGGYFLSKNWNKIFGKPNEDPTESAGARSYGTAHIVSIYLIPLAMFVYYLFD